MGLFIYLFKLIYCFEQNRLARESTYLQRGASRPNKLPWEENAEHSRDKNEGTVVGEGEGSRPYCGERGGEEKDITKLHANICIVDFGSPHCRVVVLFAYYPELLHYRSTRALIFPTFRALLTYNTAYTNVYATTVLLYRVLLVLCCT